MAVARWSWKRLMAASRSSRFSVGVCTTDAVPAKVTMPMRTLRGSSSMKDLTAACAAVIRLGATSPACMLRETSIARISVMYSDGRVTVALGRAIARIAVTIASRNRKGGRWRRNAWPGPMASRTSIRLA